MYLVSGFDDDDDDGLPSGMHVLTDGWTIRPAEMVVACAVVQDDTTHY